MATLIHQLVLKSLLNRIALLGYWYQSWRRNV